VRSAAQFLEVERIPWIVASGTSIRRKTLDIPASDMGLSFLPMMKTYFSPDIGFMTCSSRNALAVSGTRCVIPAFMLLPGMVQIFFARSNSVHVASVTSLVLEAQRMQNSKA